MRKIVVMLMALCVLVVAATVGSTKAFAAGCSRSLPQPAISFGGAQTDFNVSCPEDFAFSIKFQYRHSDVSAWYAAYDASGEPDTTYYPLQTCGGHPPYNGGAMNTYHFYADGGSCGDQSRTKAHTGKPRKNDLDNGSFDTSHLCKYDWRYEISIISDGPNSGMIFDSTINQSSC